MSRADGSGHRLRDDLTHLPVLAIAALAAVLYMHALGQNGYANTFYSAAVRSMLASLHNFFFVSFDPAGLISVDKPPLGIWLQAASARLFGFDPLSVLLPEAIAGVLAVIALYGVVQKRFGRTAGLIAAATLAVFPAFVAVSRDNNVEAPLILVLILACGFALRAAEGGRTRDLLGAAVLVGLAFNIKTLAAFPVLPGMAAAYLICAPLPLRRRILSLAVAGAVMAAVSLAWIAAVELTPAAQRPYVGSSSDNSELGLAFGYNGFGRVGGQTGGPGSSERRLLHPSAGTIATGGARAPTASAVAAEAKPRLHPAPDVKPARRRPLSGGPVAFGGPAGPGRLFEGGMDDQGSWLLPLALIGIVALAASIALADRRGITPEARSIAPGSPEPAGPWRRDPRTAGLLVLGGYLLVQALILSFSRGIVHPYYVSLAAPGVAAMTGAGMVALVDLARRGPARWGLALVVLALAATVVLQVHMLREVHYMAAWIPALIALAALAVAALAVAPGGRTASAVAAIAAAALLVAPTAYAGTTWRYPVNITFPAAGPHAVGGYGGAGVGAARLGATYSLAHYVLAHEPGRRFQLLTEASLSATAPILLGMKAAAMGGYNSTDPALDGPALGRLVASGQARYVLIGGPYAYIGGNAAARAAAQSCPRVPKALWQARGTSMGSHIYLLDCRGRAAQLERRSA